MSRPKDNEAEARAERLAAALRANLKRRKSQARGRQAEAAEAGATVAEPDAPAVDKAGNANG